jgi:hypothetical protein
MEAEKELDRLDILIENAGVATRQYRTSKDGWEETSVLYKDSLTLQSTS